jgi:hypothetical protein
VKPPRAGQIGVAVAIRNFDVIGFAGVSEASNNGMFRLEKLEVTGKFASGEWAAGPLRAEARRGAAWFIELADSVISFA